MVGRGGVGTAMAGLRQSSADILRGHEFFKTMPPSAIARFVTRARVQSYPRGARIFAKGDEGHGLMAVIAGVVRISVPSDGETELTLNLIGPNGIFGEIALLDGEPRTADATAMTPCRLLLLERRDFIATLADEPSAALALLKILSVRLRRTSRQLEEASFKPAAQRLAEALLTLGRPAEIDDRDERRIRLPQRQIGNMIGLSRETTNRYLRAWHNAGVVALEPGGLTIRDAAALAALAQDGASRP